MAGFVFAIGAGIYEELVFRLLGIAGVHTLLATLGGLDETARRRRVDRGHRPGLRLLPLRRHAPVHVAAFPVLRPRGLYLGVVFVGRGFGIAVATHAAYDVLAVGAA